VSKRGELRNRVLVALTYPIAVAGAAVLLNVAILMTVVPQFKRIFEDFGTQLPAMTLLLITVSDLIIDYGVVLGVLLLLLALALLIAMRTRPALPLRAALLTAMPGIGRMYLLTCLAQFSRMLALLVRCDCPLPLALSLAASSSQNAWLEARCLTLISELERGEPLSSAARYARGIPPEMRQLFRWSERKRTFPEALDAAAEMFDSRASLQSNVIGPILEPFVIVLTGLTVGTIVMALFLPLIKLLNDLS
jgi:type II secretory pathway component PulF